MSQFRIFYTAICLLFPFLLGAAAPPSQQQEAKIPLHIEAAYGKEMPLKEEAKEIEVLFASIPLKNKTALEIGSRLGTVAFYLADKYGMRITGLDGDSSLVDASKKRIPTPLVNKVNFFPFRLPAGPGDGSVFSSESFDLIYSKITSWNARSKEQLFHECHRLLKAEGMLVLSELIISEAFKTKSKEQLDRDPSSGMHLLKTEQEYSELLKKSGFTLVSVRDNSRMYRRHCQKMHKTLSHPKKAQQLLNSYGEAELSACLNQYAWAAQGLKQGDLKLIRFVAKKDTLKVKN
jgi:cyclopropane fatty-acyl-phospholipid synthase-like methyltransferase